MDLKNGEANFLTETYEELVDRFKGESYACEFFDEAVHECFEGGAAYEVNRNQSADADKIYDSHGRSAASVNNQGLRAQLEFLYNELDGRQFYELIERASPLAPRGL